MQSLMDWKLECLKGFLSSLFGGNLLQGWESEKHTFPLKGAATRSQVNHYLRHKWNFINKIIEEDL